MYSSPVRHSPPTVVATAVLPFDLHVLGLPPAFTLSQDQTLQLKLKIFKSISFYLQISNQGLYIACVLNCYIYY